MIKGLFSDPHLQYIAIGIISAKFQEWDLWRLYRFQYCHYLFNTGIPPSLWTVSIVHFFPPSCLTISILYCSLNFPSELITNSVAILPSPSTNRYSHSPLLAPARLTLMLDSPKPCVEPGGRGETTNAPGSQPNAKWNLRFEISGSSWMTAGTAPWKLTFRLVHWLISSSEDRIRPRRCIVTFVRLSVSVDR